MNKDQFVERLKKDLPPVEPQDYLTQEEADRLEYHIDSYLDKLAQTEYGARRAIADYQQFNLHIRQYLPIIVDEGWFKAAVQMLVNKGFKVTNRQGGQPVWQQENPSQMLLVHW